MAFLWREQMEPRRNIGFRCERHRSHPNPAYVKSHGDKWQVWENGRLVYQGSKEQVEDWLDQQENQERVHKTKEAR